MVVFDGIITICFSLYITVKGVNAFENTAAEQILMWHTFRFKEVKYFSVLNILKSTCQNLANWSKITSRFNEVVKTWDKYEIWGPNGGGHDSHCLLGCDILYFGRSVPKFRWNLMPPFCLRYSGSKFLWNVGTYQLNCRVSHPRRL